MAAALLTLMVNVIPVAGVLAALPALTGRSPVGATLDQHDRLAPTSWPRPSRGSVDPGARAATARSFALLPVALDDPRTFEPSVRGPDPAPATAAKAHARTTPARRAAVRAAGRPARLWAQLRHGLTVTGVATWYFGTRGYAGTAHIAMPGARYITRGGMAPRARVCAGGRCIVVRVVDACACSIGTRDRRLADLSMIALERLGLDPRRGVYRVRVTLIAS